MAKKALRKFWKKENKGFTLVELIIVIAIIAILVAILVPNYVRYVEKSRWNNDQNQMETLVGEVNTAITETMEDNNDVFSGTATSNTGTIEVTKSGLKFGSGFSDKFRETLEKTDSKLSKTATTVASVKLKNNGKHGTNKSSKYTITVTDNGETVKAEGVWGAATATQDTQDTQGTQNPGGFQS